MEWVSIFRNSHVVILLTTVCLNHYCWHYNNSFSSPIPWLVYFVDHIFSTNIMLFMLNFPSLKPSCCSGQHMSVIVLGLIKSPQIKTRDPNALGSVLYYYKPRKLTSYPVLVDLSFTVLQATKVNKLPTWIILLHLFWYTVVLCASFWSRMELLRSLKFLLIVASVLFWLYFTRFWWSHLIVVKKLRSYACICKYGLIVFSYKM